MALFRLTAKGTIPGETFNFGLHANGAAGTSANAASKFAAALTSWWTDAVDGLTAQVTNQVSIVDAHAAELDDLTHRQVDAHDTPLALVGSAAGQMMPHEVSVAVTTRGPSANRSDRGRFYLPPLAVSTASGGRILGPTVAHLANGAAILINSLQANGYTPVILHKNGLTSDISQVDVGDVYDVQRRRRNKLLEVRTVVGV